MSDKIGFDRAKHEITHGEFLAARNTEVVWGWETPAGRIRAKRRAELVATAAGLKPGVRALEVGCGTGLFTEFFVKTGATIVAVDISPDLLEKAKSRDLPQERVQFLCQRFEDIDSQDPFDAIIGSSVLHHLAVESALDTVRNLLKPEGAMVFAEPNMLNPQIFAERTFLRRRLKHISPDETAFVRWSLQKLLERMGFNEIILLPFDWLHPHTPRAMIPLASSIGNLLERLIILREFAGSLLIQCKRPKHKG